MSKKDGYSRPGLFGSINHYDSKGHKIGESRPGFFGEYNDYDAKGHKIGETRPGFFGGMNHYDSRGHKVGETRPGFFGGMNHYDDRGRNRIQCRVTSVPSFRQKSSSCVPCTVMASTLSEKIFSSNSGMPSTAALASMSFASEIFFESHRLYFSAFFPVQTQIGRFLLISLVFQSCLV